MRDCCKSPVTACRHTGKLRSSVSGNRPPAWEDRRYAERNGAQKQRDWWSGWGSSGLRSRFFHHLRPLAVTFSRFVVLFTPKLVACTPDAPVHDPSSAVSADTRWLTSIFLLVGARHGKAFVCVRQLHSDGFGQFSWCMGSRGFWGLAVLAQERQSTSGRRSSQRTAAGGFALDVDADLRRRFAYSRSLSAKGMR